MREAEETTALPSTDTTSLEEVPLHYAPVPSRFKQPTSGLDDDRLKMSNDSTKLKPQTKRPLRKFIPEPTETLRSSRRGNRQPKNHEGPYHRSYYDVHSKFHLGYPTQRHCRVNPIDYHKCNGHVVSESRFSYASLSQRRQDREILFRVPDFPVIPSSSSEESSDSTIHSNLTSPTASSDERAGTQNRACGDENLSGCLLSLATGSAGNQWEEQTLAAFPIVSPYQLMGHFALVQDENSDGSNTFHEASTFRRESSADISWELDCLRQHKEDSEKKQHDIGASERPLTPSSRNIDSRYSSTFLSEWQKEAGMTPMTYAATPPMLGDDLVFPRSLSPECTVYRNKSTPVRGKGRRDDACSNCTGLWYAKPSAGESCGGGLWMGTCRKVIGKKPGSQEISVLTGSVVSDCDIEEEPDATSEAVVANSYANTTLRAPRVDNDNAGPDGQERIDQEFHDGFVTQIYNYLSLGYPCVARYYDYELSEVSGIPLEELRRDDLRAGPKGYVIAAGRAARRGSTAEKVCMRWIALRRYIHEWARQQPASPDEWQP